MLPRPAPRVATLKILYIGGSYSQHIAVQALAEKDFVVHVTDRTENPAAAKHAHSSHVVSATDAENLTVLARNLGSDRAQLATYGIADYACASVAHINAALSLPGQQADAVKVMIDKGETNRRLHSQGVDIPETLWRGDISNFELDNFLQTLTSQQSTEKVIVKPASANASVGVSCVSANLRAHLLQAIETAGAHDPSIVIEEFLEGEIRNIDVLVADGEVHLISMTRRIADRNIDFVPWAQYQEPLQSGESRVALEKMAYGIARAFDFAQGPFTVDYIQTARGPVVLEVSPHFHSIALEILRGNGNPHRAWFRYLRGDANWRDDLQARNETAGALLMLRAASLGRIVEVVHEEALRAHPMTRDFYRLKPNNAAILDLSAGGGMVAAAWLTGTSWAVIHEQIDIEFPGLGVKVEPDSNFGSARTIN